VVTMPTAPSAIGPALLGTGLAHAALVSTDEALGRVAGAAVNRLTVMTPFLNSDGLVAALGLFRLTRASQKRLIVRRAGGARAAVRRNWDEIAQLGVEVLDYTLAVGGGYETFHAKVALADQDLAYVGSANMTVFTRHSMELGMLVDGRAARVIANVVRGIERISIPVLRNSS
jgi:phosphatidylserine/phosphatidylglycerophosphate/cardiolipin synthase-like enzyme